MNKLGLTFGSTVPYPVPSWLTASVISRDLIPSTKIHLGNFPTPVHPLNLPGTEELGIQFFVKRDDLTSFDLSGNKVRKLEFLLAEAKNSPNNYDSVITVGGLQSNHARATAVESRQVGLDPYLILRKTVNSDGSDDDIGLTGNLLFNRLVGADIRLITPSAYAQVGSDRVCAQLAEELRDEGRNPYVIPLGGSNPLGSFGYMECVEEIRAAGIEFDHIVFGCGSGGTAAGLALGVKLAGLKTQVHAVGVCDSPEYFYEHIRETADALGLTAEKLGGPVEDLLKIHHGEGRGYARSTPEELAYIISVAQSTGVIFDPVYSGKGLYHFVNKVLPEDAASATRTFLPGQKVLYIHTGGTVGMYDKESEVVPLLPAGKVSRMRAYPPVK
jgi:D-cysteine desulfhydrase